MAHQNEHLQWIAQTEKLEGQLPSPEATASKDVPQIVNLVRQQIASGEALISLLRTSEGQDTILPPGSVALDARMAVNKIQVLLERLTQKTKDFPEQDPDADDDERGGPPLSPVPVGGPKTGSHAAAAEIPIEDADEQMTAGADEELAMIGS